MEPFGIALIGCGTVGAGVARLLLEHPEPLAARAARPLVLRRVVVRDPHKDRAVRLPRELITTDLRIGPHRPQAFRSPSNWRAASTWPAERCATCSPPAKTWSRPTRRCWPRMAVEVFDAARRHGRAIAFEASVAGGVPIIAALTQSLAANQILSLQGILNGT